MRQGPINERFNFLRQLVQALNVSHYYLRRDGNTVLAEWRESYRLPIDGGIRRELLQIKLKGEARSAVANFTEQPDKETVAYGWLTKLANRADGIYGQIRWTGTGQKAVDGGDYRFFSTMYEPSECVVLNRGTQGAKGTK